MSRVRTLSALATLLAACAGPTAFAPSAAAVAADAGSPVPSATGAVHAVVAVPPPQGPASARPDGLGPDDQRNLPRGLDGMDHCVGEHGAVGGEFIKDALCRQTLFAFPAAGRGADDADVAFQIRRGRSLLQLGSFFRNRQVFQRFQWRKYDGAIGAKLGHLTAFRARQRHAVR